MKKRKTIDCGKCSQSTIVYDNCGDGQCNCSRRCRIHHECNEYGGCEDYDGDDFPDGTVRISDLVDHLVKQIKDYGDLYVIVGYVTNDTSMTKRMINNMLTVERSANNRRHFVIDLSETY